METQLLDLARKELSSELIDKLGPNPLNVSQAVVDGTITMDECIMLDKFIAEAKQLMYSHIWTVLGSKGGVITIKLHSYPPGRKIPVIKEIRALTGLDLRSAKALSEQVNYRRGVVLCHMTDLVKTRRILADFRSIDCTIKAYRAEHELKM